MLFQYNNVLRVYYFAMYTELSFAICFDVVFSLTYIDTQCVLRIVSSNVYIHISEIDVPSKMKVLFVATNELSFVTISVRTCFITRCRDTLNFHENKRMN